jgi:hypothetical protein
VVSRKHASELPTASSKVTLLLLRERHVV